MKRRKRKRFLSENWRLWVRVFGGDTDMILQTSLLGGAVM